MSRKFTKYPSDYVKDTTDSNYPFVAVCWNAGSGERLHMAAGNLDSADLIHSIISAMELYDGFATAMADMIDPELNNQPWEDTTYENIAIDAVDLFKQNYDEWKSLKSRGREDSDVWTFISDDESIEVLS